MGNRSEVALAEVLSNDEQPTLAVLLKVPYRDAVHAIHRHDTGFAQPVARGFPADFTFAGQRAGKVASTQVLDLCESGAHQALVAWQTLPTVSYYHRKGHTNQETWDMLRDLLAFIDVPTVGKRDLLKAWNHSLTDFEDALQVAWGEADQADFIIARNIRDFATSPIPARTPEDFLALSAG